MHIVICSSIDFTPEIEKCAKVLTGYGHTVEVPLTSKKIMDGALSLEDYLEEKNRAGESAQRKIKDDVIKAYFNKIRKADAILVLNHTKKGVPNYIGGNTFLEMGFAHVLDKPIYLFNKIPDMHYADELEAFGPILLNGDLSVLKTDEVQ